MWQAVGERSLRLVPTSGKYFRLLDAKRPSARTSEDDLFIRAAAKALKKASLVGDTRTVRALILCQRGELVSVIECLDIFPTDNRDLRDPASE